MKVEVVSSTAVGRVLAPPSKSIAHRYIICAALSECVSTIQNVDLSKDILATIECASALGAEISVSGSTVTVRGTDFTLKNNELFCNESGSTLRFFVPLCLLTNQKITLKGSERLFARKLSVYEKICKEQNIEFLMGKNSLTLCGRLTSGEYIVKGNISSQFISGLLFSLPLLENDSVLKITNTFESRPYVDLTLMALKKFGIEIIEKNECEYLIKGNQKYSPCNAVTEGDYSNAAFFDALKYFGNDVTVDGLDTESLQGDKVYKQHFEALNNGFCEIDISDCPDLAPILMTFAAAKNGARFLGTRRLKIKESDRGVVMAEELSKFGADIKVSENEIIVNKTKLHAPNSMLYGHNDHRIVMSLAVLCCVFGGIIDGAEAVSKSFPRFFEVLESLGVKVKKNDT